MLATAIVVNTITEKSDIEKAFQLRRDVFMGEQGVTEEEEFDGLDNTCTHYLASVAGTVAGTVRLRTLEDGVQKIERLCVSKNYRGHGVGRKIMEKLLMDMKNNGTHTVHLYGQTHAVGFYQSFGFKAYGDEFMDARIPHRKLKLEL
tara:strand:- start:62702 stop:63142 length:441 start_codon:yes stop_codon:yes gene_type:complete